jgi:hypothetical protein
LLRIRIRTGLTIAPTIAQKYPTVHCLYESLAENIQRVTDADGFGNNCDPDLNQSAIMEPQDFVLTKSLFGRTGHPDQALHGNGVADAQDCSIAKSFCWRAPG